MENATISLFTHPTVLTAMFVGAGVLILVYILKLIRKDEDVVVQKSKNEIPSHSEKRKDATHSGKTKKKVADNRWTARNEKQAYSHPWLLTTLKGHTGSILDMDFSSNGKYLTSCGDEDPDPGGLASGESSSSSSECNKESSRSPSLEPSPRTKNGLSRRQRKNRRREPPSTEKQKKTRAKKLSSSEPDPKKCMMEVRPLKQFSKFPGPSDIFEKLLRTYMLTPDQLLLYGYPVETVYCYGSVMIYKSPRAPTHALHYKKTKFDVNAREFVPKYESNDSGQGSSSSSDSGDSLDSEESVSVSDNETSPHHQLHKSSTWPMAHSMQYERTCVRCSNIFYTTANKYITREKCNYHWGRLRAVYSPGERNHGQKEYNCCRGKEGSPGCTRGRVHVWNGIVSGANGPFEDYVRTQPGKCHSLDGTYGVFAVDCEMCYTVRGLECTKVTVVDVEGRTMYDAFVRPEHEIVDYNTRFSGITASHLSKHAKPLRQVQTELLHIINENTVLIGHGLENDLRALKIVHCNVVDTAHSFPHLKGLPYKRSLKNLAATVLDREIQCEDTGHDSFEDACTCMELMLWRVRKDFRDYLESRIAIKIHL